MRKLRLIVLSVAIFGAVNSELYSMSFAGKTADAVTTELFIDDYQVLQPALAEIQRLVPGASPSAKFMLNETMHNSTIFHVLFVQGSKGPCADSLAGAIDANSSMSTEQQKFITTLCTELTTFHDVQLAHEKLASSRRKNRKKSRKKKRKAFTLSPKLIELAAALASTKDSEAYSVAEETDDDDDLAKTAATDTGFSDSDAEGDDDAVLVTAATTEVLDVRVRQEIIRLAESLGLTAPALDADSTTFIQTVQNIKDKDEQNVEKNVTKSTEDEELPELRGEERGFIFEAYNGLTQAEVLTLAQRLHKLTTGSNDDSEKEDVGGDDDDDAKLEEFTDDRDIVVTEMRTVTLNPYVQQVVDTIATKTGVTLDQVTMEVLNSSADSLSAAEQEFVAAALVQGLDRATVIEMAERIVAEETATTAATAVLNGDDDDNTGTADDTSNTGTTGDDDDSDGEGGEQEQPRPWSWGDVATLGVTRWIY